MGNWTLAAIDSVGTILSASIFISAGILLWYRYRKKSIETTEHLSKFFISFGVYQLIYGFPVLLIGGSGFNGAFEIFSHIFFFLSLGYLSVFALALTRSGWRTIFFVSNIIIGGLSMFLFFQTWTVIYPLSGFLALVNFVGLGTLPFFRLSLDKDDYERGKLIVSGIGFFVLWASGLIQAYSSTATEYIAADAISVLGAILILVGVHFKKLFK